MFTSSQYSLCLDSHFLKRSSPLRWQLDLCGCTIFLQSISCVLSMFSFFGAVLRKRLNLFLGFAVRLERQIEAVFSSFALYSSWEPAKIVFPHEQCKLGFHNFMMLWEAARLPKKGLVFTRKLHNAFKKYMDKVVQTRV